MTELLTARLASLGYTVTSADDFLLGYALDKSGNLLKANLNVADIPAELAQVWCDYAAGMFLSEKKATGGLTGIDFVAPVKGIKEGDTSFTFAIADADTPEAKWDALINGLQDMSSYEFELARFRRLSW